MTEYKNGFTPDVRAEITSVFTLLDKEGLSDGLLKDFNLIVEAGQGYLEEIDGNGADGKLRIVNVTPI